MFERFPQKDPRTIARDIPGIFESVFPQLNPGVVAHFNRFSKVVEGVKPISDSLISESTLAHSMLFELAYVHSEYLLRGVGSNDWTACIEEATRRQSQYFDASLPESISEVDQEIVKQVSANLVCMLKSISSESHQELVIAPDIPGYMWIAPGTGDFACESNLIEVKCSAKNFGSADFRQVLMYWLLSFINTLEFDKHEWTEVTLLNPRRNRLLKLPFDDLISVTSSGQSKTEIVELFSSIIGRDIYRGLHPF